MPWQFTNRLTTAKKFTLKLLPLVLFFLFVILISLMWRSVLWIAIRKVLHVMSTYRYICLICVHKYQPSYSVIYIFFIHSFFSSVSKNVYSRHHPRCHLSTQKKQNIISKCYKSNMTFWLVDIFFQLPLVYTTPADLQNKQKMHVRQR